MGSGETYGGGSGSDAEPERLDLSGAVDGIEHLDFFPSPAAYMDIAEQHRASDLYSYPQQNAHAVEGDWAGQPNSSP